MIVLLWSIKDKDGGVLVLLDHQSAVAGVTKFLHLEVIGRCLRNVMLYAFVQVLLMVFVPGRVFDGPVTPAGIAPKYKDNGFLCFAITHLIMWFAGITDELVFIANEFGTLLVVLNVGALLFCIILYFKGIYFPTFRYPDSGRTGYGALFDFYWGTELHPRIYAGHTFDIKQWVNCRLGMLGWSVLLVAFLQGQIAQYGQVSNAFLASFILQQAYIAKFFAWESGYMASIDIMHDRLGFYICWGCLVWLPSLYPSGAYFLMCNTKPGPSDMPTWALVVTIAAGVVMIVITYLADEQRQHVRRMKGKTLVWGSPAQFLLAEYVSSDKKVHRSILLTSGWWAVSRYCYPIT